MASSSASPEVFEDTSWDTVIAALGFLVPKVPETPLPDVESVIRTGLLDDLQSRRGILDRRKILLRRAMALHDEEESRYGAERDIVSLADRRVRNAALPVHRLPPELLLAIFRVVQNRSHWRSALKYHWRSALNYETYFRPAVLASVCHIWYQLIFESSSPSFWTDVVLRGHGSWTLGPAFQPRHLIWLHRSRPLPIDLQIRGGRHDGGVQSWDLVPAIPVIANELSRLRSLYIDDPTPIKQLFPLVGFFANLEYLCIDGNAPLSVDVVPLFGDATFPRLVTLELSDFGKITEHDVQALFAGQRQPEVQRLILRDIIWDTPGILAGMLHGFPRLLHLELKGLCRPTTTSSVDQSIRMPALLSASFDTVYLATMLPFIHAPNLTTVRIHDKDWKWAAPRLVIPFASSPRLEHLDFRYIDTTVFDPTQVLTVGSLQLVSLADNFGCLSGVVQCLGAFVSQSDSSETTEPLVNAHTTPMGVETSSAHRRLVFELQVIPREEVTTVTYGEPPMDLPPDETRFFACLKELAVAMERSRKALEPAGGFGVRLSHDFVVLHPGAAVLVSQFPDFFEVDHTSGAS